ncbi:MAG: hypothetical protein HYT61_01975 [Candidatus Yanofskybacteria bacterium]|nr:hypothetical protein [Candidatus Yanofskybacteria bacterium]
MITNRQGALLASIIENFIRTAEPVSSKLLEKSGFFGLSSATIRSEMNDLEELGFLAHLYTSSGRIPTDMAYRYYVDNIVSEKQEMKNEKQEKEIKTAIVGAGDDPREINRIVAQTLSDLSENLVITNIIDEDEFFKVGLSSLFEMPEFREFDRMFRLTSFFDEFDSLFNQIEKEFFIDDIKVFIGRENPVRNIRDETIMFARYNLPQNLTGSLTLVGPTRMDYAKNLGLIKYVTHELNKLSKTV